MSGCLRSKAAITARQSRMKAAHWTQRTHLFRADEFICSACRSVSDKPYSVCPVCGASMKKTRQDASWVDEAEGLSAMLDDDW